VAALAVARRSLPPYAHKYSPKTYTQHQLFACLVLKNFWRTDYRGAVAMLADCPELVATLGLPRVPHFTTLQKVCRRLMASRSVQRLLDATVRQHLRRKRRVKSAAIDSTGLQAGCASGYFAKRRRYGKTSDKRGKKTRYHRYPKLGVVCNARDHFVLAMHAGQGPRPDVDEFRPLVAQAQRRVRMLRMVADAGYDSEPNHCFARQECGIRTIIPPEHGRPTDKPATGRYRRLMQTRFDREAYHERSQIETVISMIKRRQGSYVRGVSYWSRCRDLRLMVLTHNILILVLIQVFYRAGRSSFFGPLAMSCSSETMRLRFRLCSPLANPLGRAGNLSIGKTTLLRSISQGGSRLCHG